MPNERFAYIEVTATNNVKYTALIRVVPDFSTDDDLTKYDVIESIKGRFSIECNKSKILFVAHIVSIDLIEFQGDSQ